MTHFRRQPLVSLPQCPSVWPPGRPLDPSLVHLALWEAGGNLTNAAKLLNIPLGRFAAYVRRTPELTEARAQAADLLLDKAERTLHDALDDLDPVRADGAAKFVLEKAGKSRGWNTKEGGVSLAFGANSSGAGMVVKWQSEE